LDINSSSVNNLKQPEEIVSGIRWAIVIALVLVHTLALTAALPWLFSWSGLLLMIAGLYFFGTLGINLCFHRLLTHRSFKCPRWLEKILTCLGLCNMQGSSIHWVAAHRAHHQHSDHRPDPHSPLVSFFWSHIGWLCVWNKKSDSLEGLSAYAGDLCRDPFHFKLEKHSNWIWIWLTHAVLFFIGGFVFGSIFNDGLRMGLSWLVWGVLVRMVAVWHITWAINSVTHVWGYRTHNTPDNSKNNWLMGLVGMGEGWHNNHHANQRMAAHGQRWWEIDVTYWSIWVLKKLGLAWDLR
jgi:fatty-acid desaturase